MQTLLKVVPESLFRLTDFAVRALAGFFFSKPLVYCELGFRKPPRKSTGGFPEYVKLRSATLAVISEAVLVATGLARGADHHVAGQRT